MQRLLSILVTLVWGLWLGGLITVFLAATSLFSYTFPQDRHLAGKAAAGIFSLFERYQLGLAAAALVLSFLWRVTGGATKLKTTLFCLFAVASMVAVVQTMHISPQLDRLRQEGLMESSQFKELHGKSMFHYTAESVVLLVGVFIMIPAVRADGVAKPKSAAEET